MGIYAEKKESSDFVQIEPGTYVARCFSMIEIGTIEIDFNGENKKQKKVMVSWELPTETAIFHDEKGPEPFAVSKTYTLSLHEKSTLRKDLESWRGKGFTEEESLRFDITQVLGKPCIISVIHEPGKTDAKKTYTKVATITKMMKGQECPPQVNPTRMLCYEEFNWEIFESLSDYTKDKIRSSEEFQRMQEPTIIRDIETGNDENNDLPF